MSAGEPLEFEDVSSSILSFLTWATRRDLGLDPDNRDVPAGTWFADALRCQAMEFAMITAEPPGVVEEVCCLANTTADLIEGVGRG